MAASVCRCNFANFSKTVSLFRSNFPMVTTHRCKAIKSASEKKPLDKDGQMMKRSPFSPTDDGIIKQSGLLINKWMTFDGKPVFPGKYKTIKLEAGVTVRTGDTLLQQKRLDFHPGLYVGLGRDLTLYAFEDGIVYVTCEKVNLNWNMNLVRRFYFDQRDMNVYKMYYHVIPEVQHNRFKLVNQM